MLPLDSLVHHAVLDAIVATGAAPAAGAIALALDEDVAEIEAALDRLHAAHALVLHPGSRAIWIAHPFSLSPTGTWVQAGARGWWAPCLWCAFGIHSVLGDDDVDIHTRIAGEAEELRIELRGRALSAPSLLAHFALPPRRAWDNVVHFCAMLLPFRSERDIDAWSARHGLPRGVAVPLPQLLALARAWYGRHLARDWTKPTADEAEAIFASVGLAGDHWQIPGGGRSFGS